VTSPALNDKNGVLGSMFPNKPNIPPLNFHINITVLKNTSKDERDDAMVLTNGFIAERNSDGNGSGFFRIGR
jgi:hypothetical protein